MNLADPTERELAAGEYVLGTLTAAQAAAVERAMEADPALRDMVAYWERRLAGLADLAAPAEPSASLWDRIARDLPRPEAHAPAPPRPRAWRRVGFWQAATGLAAAAAVLLAVYVSTVPPTAGPPAYTAVLQSAQDAAVGYLLRAADGEIVLSPVGSLAVAADRSLELWTVTDPDAGPVSLGVLSPDEPSAVPAPGGIAPGQIFMVSLEQAGGSPTGLPQGPVLFQGRAFAPPE